MALGPYYLAMALNPASRALGALVLSTALLGSAACGGSSPIDRTPGDPVAHSSDSAKKQTKQKKQKKQAPQATQPAPGFLGDGYGFDTPRGWQDATARFRALQPTIDLAVVETEVADGYADNVNVIVSPWTGSIGALQEQGLAELASVADDSRSLGRVTIAGVRAGHVLSSITFGKMVVASEQFFALADGRATIITFSVDRAKSDAQRRRTVAAVLDSWVWLRS